MATHQDDSVRIPRGGFFKIKIGRRTVIVAGITVALTCAARVWGNWVVDRAREQAEGTPHLAEVLERAERSDTTAAAEAGPRVTRPTIDWWVEVDGHRITRVGDVAYLPGGQKVNLRLTAFVRLDTGSFALDVPVGLQVERMRERPGLVVRRSDDRAALELEPLSPGRSVGEAALERRREHEEGASPEAELRELQLRLGRTTAHGWELVDGETVTEVYGVDHEAGRFVATVRGTAGEVGTVRSVLASLHSSGQPAPWATIEIDGEEHPLVFDDPIRVRTGGRRHEIVLRRSPTVRIGLGRQDVQLPTDVFSTVVIETGATRLAGYRIGVGEVVVELGPPGSRAQDAFEWGVSWLRETNDHVGEPQRIETTVAGTTLEGRAVTLDGGNRGEVLAVPVADGMATVILEYPPFQDRQRLIDSLGPVVRSLTDPTG